MMLDCGGRLLDLTAPRVMGVLNVTHDSFSVGGVFFAPDAALRRVERMLEEGADLIDVGGESTRPGAADVDADEERRRVVPVIDAIARRFAVPIAIDSSKADVMRAAADVGAGLINDVRALREPGALTAARATGLPVCLMHMQGSPRTMQHAPHYDDVLADVMSFLEQRLRVCEAAGLSRERLLVDPGFGFGKRLAHNLALLAGLQRLSGLRVPILVGLSRKSMLGSITGRDVGERGAASVAAAMLAAQRGAVILRVHDVAETVDALKVMAAVSGAEPEHR